MAARKRGLGRGLDALLGAGNAGQPASAVGDDPVDAGTVAPPDKVLKELPVDLV